MIIVGHVACRAILAQFSGREAHIAGEQGGQSTVKGPWRKWRYRESLDLLIEGVRCWFAPRDLRPGTVIIRGIDEAIHVHDKLLLILSKESVPSNWVEHEVDIALFKEMKRKRQDVLFPIRLDNAVLESKAGWAKNLCHRHIGDFTKWKQHDDYQQAFTRLLRDLKAEAAKGE